MQCAKQVGIVSHTGWENSVKQYSVNVRLIVYADSVDEALTLVCDDLSYLSAVVDSTIVGYSNPTADDVVVDGEVHE